MPDLGAQNTVRTAANFPTTVERPLVLDPVQIVTHHRRVVRPAFFGLGHLVIAIQKTDPLAGRGSPRNTDQFGPEPRNDETKSVLFVGQDIEEAVIPRFFASEHKPLACAPSGVALR